jgi:hypothetical protein
MRLAKLLLFLGSTLLLSSSAQAATGDTLLVHLRIRLGQTTAAHSNWTDNQLLACLNMAQDWMAAQGRVVEKLDTIPGSGSLLLDSIPSDFIKLKGTAYLWRNGVEVKPIPMVSADSLYRLASRLSTQEVGVDNYWLAEDGQRLSVVPLVNTADSVVISYYAYPTKFDSANVECDFGPEWEQVLLSAAKAVALEKIESPLWPAAVAERDKLVAAMYRQQTLKPQLVSVP